MGSPPDDAEAGVGIKAVLATQQAAWNRGDIDAFMEGYARAESTTFVSADTVTRGWQTVLDNYRQRYPSRDRMGTLAFSDLEVFRLADDLALVDGSWRLDRAGDTPHGRFTLLFRRVGSGWRIVHDTTTSAP